MNKLYLFWTQRPGEERKKTENDDISGPAALISISSLKETHYAFLFFCSVFSARPEAPLSHRKHHSWNVSLLIL